MRSLFLLITIICLAPALAQESDEPSTTVEVQAQETEVRPRQPQLELWPAEEAYRRLQLERRLKGEEPPETGDPTSLELSHQRGGGWKTRILASQTPDLSELGVEQQLNLPDQSLLELRWDGRWGQQQLQQLSLGWQGGGESIQLSTNLEGRWAGEVVETKVALAASGYLGLGFEAFTEGERRAETQSNALYEGALGLRFTPWEGYQFAVSSRLATRPEGLPLRSYKGRYSGWFIGDTRLSLETEQELEEPGRRASSYSAEVLYRLEQWLSISGEAKRRLEVDGTVTDTAGGKVQLHW